MHRLIIIGRGPLTEQLAEACAGFYEATGVCDDAPGDLSEDDHVLLATGDPDSALGALEELAKTGVLPKYLGYVGPRDEAGTVQARLATRLGPEHPFFQALLAPCGVPVFAESPHEYAIAVAAELVALKRNPQGFQRWRRHAAELASLCGSD